MGLVRDPQWLARLAKEGADEDRDFRTCLMWYTDEDLLDNRVHRVYAAVCAIAHA